MQIVFKWTCHTYLPQYPSLLSPWPRLPDHPPRASQAGRRIASPARRVTSVKGFPAMHRFLPALLCILPLMPAPARGDRPRRVQRPRDEPAIGHAGAPRSVGFGPRYAAGIRRRPQTRDTWHLDEVFIRMGDTTYYRWRMVDADGMVLDVLVEEWRNQRRRPRPTCGGCWRATQWSRAQW